MRFKLRKLLLRLIGFELLLKEMTRLLHRGMDSIKEEVNQKLRALLLQGLLLLLLIGLLGLAFVFGMLALALYLNEVFYSAYQGFLVVAGGCLGLAIPLLILIKVRWPKNSS